MVCWLAILTHHSVDDSKTAELWGVFNDSLELVLSRQLKQSTDRYIIKIISSVLEDER